MTPREQSQFRVLRTLEAHPDLTQRELANRIGLSVGKTNYLLRALVEKGAVKIENFKNSNSKLKKLAYFLTPAGLTLRLRLTQDYLVRVQMQYEALEEEIRALRREASGQDETDDAGARANAGE